MIQIAQNKCFSKTDVNWWISTNLPAELDKNMSLRWIKLFLKFSVALNLWLGLSQRKTMQIIKFRWVSVGFGLEKVDARLLFFSSLGKSFMKQHCKHGGYYSMEGEPWAISLVGNHFQAVELKQKIN